MPGEDLCDCIEEGYENREFASPHEGPMGYYACDRHSGGNKREESIGCSLRKERSLNFWLDFERGIARQNPSWYPWFMGSFGVWLLITSAGNAATTPSSRQRWFTK